MADPVRVLTILGTRPEAVKLAPVVMQLKESQFFQPFVCITAQHREMLDQVLELFEIKPDFDLNLMTPDQSLAELTASVFQELDRVVEQVQPDWVLVQGDTTTVMAASLLAYYHQVRVGHVEAGLRTGDKWQPFPEEINRRVAGVVADLHFAPTDQARDNLLAEGVRAETIHVTGNPVIDALEMMAERIDADGTMPFDWVKQEARLVVLTAHRRENFGAPLESIFNAIVQLADRYGEQIQFVYPVHLNPNVQDPAHRLLADYPNIILTEPLAYLPMVQLMRQAYLILTDSGGIQEEAPGLGVPVLVLREKTERPEALEAGTARLIGTNTDRIVAEVSRLMQDPDAYRSMAQAINPFGDGRAAERIVSALIDASD
ncbi:MAG: non-hydrolyzing UDP-N-acetylglucosamine 2-epimerase [Anaerolineales bacterium]